MSALENIKQIAEKATGWRQPSSDDMARLVHPVEAVSFRFDDDGAIPNHPHWPLMLYPGAVQLPSEFDIRRRYSNSCLRPTAGALPGATGSMNTRIIIRVFMKCSALRAATPRFVSAAYMGA
jgi:hypothetical protein